MPNLNKIKQFPHCDALVLHGPDAGCDYCNEHPDWQQLRQMWNINFTGENNPDKTQCPAEARRPLNTINQWGGNVPQKEVTSGT